jgi:hypothetical protein
MRQHPGVSKADLVENGARSATGSAKMARRAAFTRPIWMKTLWIAALPGTLGVANFADRAVPGGVGTLARSLGRMPPQPGDAIFSKPEAGQRIFEPRRR